MAYTTRSMKDKSLSGLLPDPIADKQTAINKAKSVYIYTYPNTSARRELLKKTYDGRKKACYKKKGDIYVCGYTTRKKKVVKPYCRKLPKKTV